MQDDLETRVKRLERENRRIKRGALLALVLAGGVVVTGQTTEPKVSDEVRTKRLVVVDEAGEDRAELRVDRGQPQLSLWGKTRGLQAYLFISSDLEEDGTFVLQNKSGRKAVIGAGHFATTDKDDKTTWIAP